MMPGDDYIDLFLKLDSLIEHGPPCRDNVLGKVQGSENSYAFAVAKTSSVDCVELLGR